MANPEKITELIDEKALQNWEKFVDSLEKAQDLMATTAIHAAEINKAMGQAKNMGQYSKSAEQAALAQERLRQAAIRTQQAEERLAAQRKRHQAADARAARQEENQRRRQEAQTKRLNSEYARLDAELTKVRTRAQDVGAQMFRLERAGDTTSKTYLRLQRRFENLSQITQLLDTRMKQIDSTLGKHQRHVGNYERGWNGLAMSINQLTREAPAFAVSFQTGILALSNNIPIFIDEITKLRAANAALVAQGQKAIPVWRQLIVAFLSWQTLLSLSVTLLTVYGKEIGEFVSNMFGAKRAIDSARASQEAFNEAVTGDEFKDAIRDVIEIRSAMKLYQEGVTTSTDVLNRYNETIGQTVGEAKNLADVEKFLSDNANAYIQFTLLKAAANIQLGKAAAAAASIQEASAKSAEESATLLQRWWAQLTNPGLGGAGLAEAQKDIEEMGRKRREALIRVGIQDRDTFIANAEELLRQADVWADKLNIPLFSSREDKDDKGKKEVDAELKLQQFRAQALADNNRRIADNDKATFDERADAADVWREQMERVIDLQRQMDLQLANNAAERQLAEEKASQALIELADEDKDILLGILQDQLDEEDRLRSEAWANRKLQLEQQQHEELQALDRQYINREIGEKEYQERRKQIAYDYAKAYIAQEILALEELIAVEKARGKDVGESERELARLKMKYSEEATRKQIDDLKKVEDAEKEISKLKRELAEEVFNLGVALFEANVERELQDIERQEQQLDQRVQRELDAINAMALSEEEKQQRILGVEQRAEAERQVLEQKRRQAEIKQARLSKNTRMAEAVMSTAAGVARAFADYIFPYSAIIAGLVGALGAVQIATIASTPIPQYFRGVKSSPEGIAHVGEKGTELLRFPDGSEVLTPNRDTLAWLPKGTEVLTSDQTKRYLAKQAMQDVGGRQANTIDITPLVRQQALTNAQLKKLQKPSTKGTVLTKNGLIHVHRNGTKWSNYLRRNGL